MRSAMWMTAAALLLTAACDQEPPPKPKVAFSATARLEGATLTIVVTPDHPSTARVDALTEGASLYANMESVTLHVPVEKLEEGATSVEVSAGASTKSVDIVAGVALSPSLESVYEEKKARERAAHESGYDAKTWVWKPMGFSYTFTSPEIGGPITTEGNLLRRGGVVVQNVRSASAVGQSLTIKNNEAQLDPSFLTMLRDHAVDDLLPRGSLDDWDKPFERTFSLEAVSWSGEKVTHAVKVVANRQAAQNRVRDELRELAEGKVKLDRWEGGRGVFLASEGVSDGDVSGAKKFSDIGFVVWIESEPSSRRQVGKCSFVGRSLERFEEDGKATIRRLPAGEIVATETLKAPPSTCPSSVYAEKDTILVSSPRPSDALPVVKRVLAKLK